MDFFGEMDTNSQHVVSHFPIWTRTLLEIDISLLSFFLKVFTAALTFRSFDTIWSILDILLIYSLFWLARTSCIRLPIKCKGPKLNLSTSSIEKNTGWICLPFGHCWFIIDPTVSAIASDMLWIIQISYTHIPAMIFHWSN